MRFILVLSALLINLVYFNASAQNINQLEYFFDNDPGLGNGNAIVPSSASDSIFVNSNINSASVGLGFHTLCFRAKNTSNQWSQHESRLLYISPSSSSVSKINRIEYFFDTDPGQGNGTVVNVTSGDSIFIASIIPSASLSLGFHTLSIRTKDSSGQWSQGESKLVFVTDDQAALSKIKAAEYFFDNDPGQGNGIGLNIGLAANTISLLPTLSASSLSTGFHLVGLRFQDSLNRWSSTESRLLFIKNNTTTTIPLVSAEYFFDADPGVGNGIALGIGAPADSLSFSSIIASASLTEGMHQLVVRTKNANGLWSQNESRLVYIRPGKENLIKITGGEYFFDTDPGIGNAAVFNFSLDSVEQFEILPFASGALSNGIHLIGMRVVDSAGNYSNTEYDSILVQNFVLPLELKSFRVQQQQNSALLKWETEHETNLLGFIIEKSNNGINFKELGYVEASNQVSQQYNYLDTNLLQGFQFYRLKMLNADASFQYSSIHELFCAKQNNIKTYPNPASEYIALGIELQREALLNIMNINGQLVKSYIIQNHEKINISHLSSGKYYIKITDGRQSYESSFIKQ